MRPCLLLNDFNSGGAERLVRDLVVELQAADGINPVVIVSNDRGKLQPTFEKRDIEFVSLDTDIGIKTVLQGVRKLTDVLLELDVDLVHSHLAFSDIISRLACARLSLPHISTYHNVSQERSLLKRAFERSTWRLSDRIVCVSDGVRQSYREDPRMRVIYNAIDVQAFNRRVSEADQNAIPREARSAETVYLNVGRYVAVKRQHDLIDAMACLDVPDTHLLIVGNGPLQQDLEEYATATNAQDRVTVTGFVEQIEPYYSIADVFVSSSEHEGLPTTHIEAMAAKLPIVTTAIPGVAEIVEEGTNGYLRPVGEPEALAKAMERVQSTDTQQLGAHGFEIAAERFSIEQLRRRHVELYREVV